MTGNCDSKRAIKLIEKCARRYIVDGSFTRTANEGFQRIQEKVNGKTVENLGEKRHDLGSDRAAYYATVEAYILIPGANNKNVIAFLRGETNELNLNF